MTLSIKTPDGPVALVATKAGADLHIGNLCLLLAHETIDALATELTRYDPDPWCATDRIADRADTATHNALEHLKADRPEQALYWLAAASHDVVQLCHRNPIVGDDD
jgi:hypothetical protein